MATYYVRPDSSHGGANDGTSYADAWQGLSAITWGASGVGDGDELYFCGLFTVSGSNFVVGAHGATSVATSCVLKGDYPSDPGEFVMSGAVFVFCGRQYTIIRNLKFTQGTSLCLQISNAGKDVQILNNEFVGASTTSNKQLVQLFAANGTSHDRITFRGNTFRDVAYSATTGEGACIDWFITNANQTGAQAASPLNDLTIAENTFKNIVPGRAVIGLKVQNTTNVATVMTNVTITDNVFSNCGGYFIEASTDRDTADLNTGLVVTGNRATGGKYPANDPSAITGAFLIARGWANATIKNNRADAIIGDSGGANVFYGAYEVSFNKFSNIQGVSIDGNGILFDHGCHDCVCTGNVIDGCAYIPGVWYSGTGILVLDVDGVTVQGNSISNCYNGLSAAAAASGTQVATFRNNTCLNVTNGFATASNSVLGTVTLEQNIFTGDGTGYSVYDQTALTWTGETNNYFYNFIGTYQHTLDGTDSTSDPSPYLNSDGSLKSTGYTLASPNPLATAGTYAKGLVLKNGRARSEWTPVGAYIGTELKRSR